MTGNAIGGMPDFILSVSSRPDIRGRGSTPAFANARSFLRRNYVIDFTYG
jgi:hypothetical protein